MGVGEALVSLLDEKGVPGIVGRTLIRPPASRLGPATKAERKAVMADSPVGDIYDTMIDRESAYEMLQEKTEKIKEEAEKSKKADTKTVKKKTSTRKKKDSTSSRRSSSRRSSGRRKKTATDHVLHEVKLVGRQLMRSQGRKIIRGILGGMMRR